MKKRIDTSDNWLKEELEREARTSAWDFDEGKKVKAQHDENCERDKVERYHAQHHSNLNEESLYSDLHGEKKGVGVLEGEDETTKKLFGFCFCMIFISFFLGSFLSGIIAFLGVNPGLFILMPLTEGKPLGKKALPYWLLLSIVDIVMFSYKYIKLLANFIEKL